MFLQFMYCLLFGTAIAYYLYKWSTKNKDYFVERNLKSMKQKFPIGNTMGLFLNQYTPSGFMDKLYYEYPNEKLFGIYDMMKPVFFARDLDFIKQITIKDFDYFEDHIGFIDSSADKLFGNSLFMLEGKKWRDMRATLSPAFTGSKMRNMFELVTECADEMTKHFLNEANQGKQIRLETKQLCMRYSSDIIASCAFGLKVNSFKDRDNDFFTVGRSLNFSSKIIAIKIVLLRLMPKLMNFFGFELFSDNVKRFFRSMVLDTMKEREEKHILRHDMINILMQVRKGSLEHGENDEQMAADAGFATVEESTIGRVQVKRTWTDDEIISQCFLFFVAGFDTVSTMITFLMYELAIAQDIQQKLYEEIRETSDALNGARLTYDILPKMKYLDQIICEILRKWPPAVFTNRICTKNYSCKIDGYEKFLIEKGQSIWIPIIAIHNDPKYYPEPEKFDPERFSDENKRLIISGAFLPFGLGPRNCIGSRFALMEIKALVYYVILNFNVQPFEKTQIPIKIAKAATSWVFEGGVHLEWKARSS